jgi:hypothetical protein
MFLVKAPLLIGTLLSRFSASACDTKQMLCFKPSQAKVARIIVESRRRNSTSNHHGPDGQPPGSASINLKPEMEQLLTAVIVAPFVVTMVGFAVAIAFAPAAPNEIAPATSHDHDSRQLHRATPRRWSGKA